MPKTFYTKIDIEDLAARGSTVLQLDSDVVLTAEAKDTAQKLGLQLFQHLPPLPASPRSPGQVPDLQSRARNLGPSWFDKMIPPKVDAARLRLARLARIREELKKRDCAACVLVDAVNVRYATDSRNMQVFSSRNPARYVFIPVEGPVILFEFAGCFHLAAGLETVDEIRPATTVSYAAAGPRVYERAQQWALEIGDLMRQYGGGSRRIGLERVNSAAAAALAAQGFEVIDAQEPVERARAIKSPDELECIRWSLRVVEAGVQRMRQALRPGMSETELWSILHQAVIQNDGDYIETRLLSSGPRTNPWFQEAGPRLIEASDLVALDTDVVGPFGYYADFSRTFFCGTGRPSDKQRHLYKLAYEHIQANMEIIKPGMTFREVAEKGWTIPEPYVKNRYFVLAHGVSMTGEYPYILHNMDFKEAYDGLIEPNMTLCIESFIGAEGDADDDSEGVKLEEQVLVTDTGIELLSHFPFEEALLGREI
jgi:Xaa-Pro aminopeptidase